MNIFESYFGDITALPSTDYFMLKELVGAQVGSEVNVRLETDLPGIVSATSVVESETI